MLEAPLALAWALLLVCTDEPCFVRYLPHEQAAAISFFQYLDHEPTGKDVRRARESLGEAA